MFPTKAGYPVSPFPPPPPDPRPLHSPLEIRDSKREESGQLTKVRTVYLAHTFKARVLTPNRLFLTITPSSPADKMPAARLLAVFRHAHRHPCHAPGRGHGNPPALPVSSTTPPPGVSSKQKPQLEKTAASAADSPRQPTQATRVLQRDGHPFPWSPKHQKGKAHRFPEHQKRPADLVKILSVVPLFSA